MLNKNSLFVVLASMTLATSNHAQWLGTNPEQLTGPAGGVIIGTGGAAASALTVRGDQMAPATGEVFRTTGGTDMVNNWRMFRTTGWGGAGGCDAVQQLGRIYCNIGASCAAPNYGFNIQQTRQGGSPDHRSAQPQ